MEWFVRAFIKASLAWLGLGVTLGVAMAAEPAWIVYRPAHVHMNLLGFVTMMIYGVAYHVLPRFSGHPLFYRQLPALHWALANLGLATMVVGFGLRPHLGGERFPPSRPAAYSPPWAPTFHSQYVADNQRAGPAPAAAPGRGALELRWPAPPAAS